MKRALNVQIEGQPGVYSEPVGSNQNLEFARYLTLTSFYSLLET